MHCSDWFAIRTSSGRLHSWRWAPACWTRYKWWNRIFSGFRGHKNENHYHRTSPNCPAPFSMRSLIQTEKCAATRIAAMCSTSMSVIDHRDRSTLSDFIQIFLSRLQEFVTFLKIGLGIEIFQGVNRHFAKLTSNPKNGIPLVVKSINYKFAAFVVCYPSLFRVRGGWQWIESISFNTMK